MTHQSSRDAAADLATKCGMNTVYGINVSLGNVDDGVTVQAFETHRATVTAELVERLTGVEGLRTVVAKASSEWPMPPDILLPGDPLITKPLFIAQAIADHIRAVAEEAHGR